MPYQVSPLPGQAAFGAVVTELEPDDIGDPAIQASLRKLWIDVGVIVFRGMEGGEETHLRLSRMFGKLKDHPMYRGLPEYHPELIELFYEAKRISTRSTAKSWAPICPGTATSSTPMRSTEAAY